MVVSEETPHLESEEAKHEWIREQLVADKLTGQEIATATGLTPGRISQLRGKYRREGLGVPPGHHDFPQTRTNMSHGAQRRWNEADEETRDKWLDAIDAGAHSPTAKEKTRGAAGERWRRARAGEAPRPGRRKGF